MPTVETTKHMFGRDIVHRFTPMVAGEAYDIDTDLFIEARLYESQPSGSALTTEGDANAIESGVASVVQHGNQEYSVSFSALTDTDSGTPGDYVYRWAVVNFRTEAGGPVVYLVDRLTIWRSSSITSRMRLDLSSIEALDYQLYKLTGDAQILKTAEEARTDIIMRLKAYDKELDNFFDLEELNSVFKYTTLAYMARSRANEENPFWFDKYKNYLEEADKFYKQSTVGHAGEKDTGTPSSQAHGGPMIVNR